MKITVKLSVTEEPVPQVSHEGPRDYRRTYRMRVSCVPAAQLAQRIGAEPREPLEIDVESDGPLCEVRAHVYDLVRDFVNRHAVNAVPYIWKEKAMSIDIAASDMPREEPNPPVPPRPYRDEPLI